MGLGELNLKLNLDIKEAVEKLKDLDEMVEIIAEKEEKLHKNIDNYKNTKFCDRQYWLEEGIKQGWCSPPVCWMHDGIPLTAREERELEEGEELCVHVIRPYVDDKEKTRVEDSHAPSLWRKASFLRDNECGE